MEVWELIISGEDAAYVNFDEADLEAFDAVEKIDK